MNYVWENTSLAAVTESYLPSPTTSILILTLCGRAASWPHSLQVTLVRPWRPALDLLLKNKGCFQALLTAAGFEMFAVCSSQGTQRSKPRLVITPASISINLSAQKLHTVRNAHPGGTAALPTSSALGGIDLGLIYHMVPDDKQFFHQQEAHISTAWLTAHVINCSLLSGK